MSAKSGFCSKHQHDIRRELERLGLWSKVLAKDSAITVEIAKAWMAGMLRKEYLCPLVITMLELQAKANRMADQAHGTKGAFVSTCPCCAIQRLSNDETADAKVIKGQCDVTLGLMQTNGLAGGTEAESVARHRAASLAIHNGS